MLLSSYQRMARTVVAVLVLMGLALAIYTYRQEVKFDNGIDQAMGVYRTICKDERAPGAKIDVPWLLWLESKGGIAAGALAITLMTASKGEGVVTVLRPFTASQMREEIIGRKYHLAVGLLGSGLAIGVTPYVFVACRRKRNVCVECGYCLQGLGSLRCPECGCSRQH